MCFDIPKNGHQAETTRTSSILKTTTGFNCNGIVTKKKKKKTVNICYDDFLGHYILSLIIVISYVLISSLHN